MQWVDDNWDMTWQVIVRCRVMARRLASLMVPRSGALSVRWRLMQ